MILPFYFKNPAFLWLLLALVPLTGLLLLGNRRRSELLRQFGRTELLREFSCLSSGRSRFFSAAILGAFFVLVVLALARPVLPGQHVRVKEGILDAVIVLDVSKSMAAEDYPNSTSRLKKAKEVIESLLEILQGNRVGLVTFAREGFPQAELTDDFLALKFVLKYWVEIESAPGGGTAFRPAIKEALQLFDQKPRNKLLVLLSDGGDEAPETVEPLLAEMRAKGIKIISLGLGRPEGSPIPLYDEKGKFKDWIQYQESLVLTHLNDSPLKTLGEGTSGIYRRIRTGLEIRPLFRDRRVVESRLIEGEMELYQIFLGLGLVLLWWNRFFLDP